MPRVSRNFAALIRNDSLILLARIVDSVRVIIRPADVRGLRYWIYELDPNRPNLRTVVPGHNGVELYVEQIVFESLQVGGAWTIDRTGYNFRHEIRAARRRGFPKPGMDYELRYQFVSSHRESFVLRFEIRCAMLNAKSWMPKVEHPTSIRLNQTIP
jgi:hypothetical protein